ncbi:MAG: hypothetical protein QOG62_2096, partial [Thermoleophilaceae bacterium]|nr:hypothetical protein [Thermoleophilaceae bacterium]
MNDRGRTRRRPVNFALAQAETDTVRGPRLPKKATMNRPSSAGIRALLPLAAALFLTVAAVPAQAAKVQHGVQLVHNEPKIAEPEAITRMQQAHVDLIRTTFDWLYAEPTEDGGFDFTQLDDFMKAASTGRRIQVLPALVSSPNWISPKQPGDPPLGTAELNRWDAYVRALIARYGDNGTFFTDTPGVTYNPIRDWQVWNEPNLKSFWTNQHPNAKEYEPFLAHTSKVIR